MGLLACGCSYPSPLGSFAPVDVLCHGACAGSSSPSLTRRACSPPHPPDWTAVPAARGEDWVSLEIRWIDPEACCHFGSLVVLRQAAWPLSRHAGMCYCPAPFDSGLPGSPHTSFTSAYGQHYGAFCASEQRDSADE